MHVFSHRRRGVTYPLVGGTRLDWCRVVSSLQMTDVNFMVCAASACFCTLPGCCTLLPLVAASACFCTLLPLVAASAWLLRAAAWCCLCLLAAGSKRAAPLRRRSSLGSCGFSRRRGGSSRCDRRGVYRSFHRDRRLRPVAVVHGVGAPSRPWGLSGCSDLPALPPPQWPPTCSGQ